MKTKRFFIFELPAVLLAFGLVFTACNLGTDTSDTTPPTLISAVVANATSNQLILTFSEPTTADSAAGWTLTGAHISGDPTGLGTATWTVPLSSNVTSGSTLSMSYNSSAGNTRDTAGNPLRNIASFTVTNNVSGSDTTSPSLISAVVANAAPNQLILIFSEPTTADSAVGWTLDLFNNLFY
jgi:hypothetical protein